MEIFSNLRVARMRCLPLLWLALAMPMAPAAASVDGVVVDAGTGAPIANANVQLEGGSLAVQTDAAGVFHFTVPIDILAPRAKTSRSPDYPVRSLSADPFAPAGSAAGYGSASIGYAADGRFFASGHPAFAFRFMDPKALANGEPGFSTGKPAGYPAAMNAAVKSGAANAAAPCLLALQAAGYHARESNCVADAQNRVELSAEAAGKYHYQIPVAAGDGWTSGDLRTALPAPNGALAYMDSLAAKKFKEIHSFLIVKGGQLVAEDYFLGNADSIDFEHGIKRILKGNRQWGRTDKHYLASCNKSITSMMVGLALSKGGFTLATPMAQMLPAYQAQFTGTKANITVEHALTMTMGFTWDEWAGPDLAQMWATQDLAAYVLSKTMAAAPGEQWIYNSGGPNMLLTGLQSKVGDVARFGDSALFAPLGITDYRWEKQPTGQPEAAARMFMRPRDMAKLGLLFLQGGLWNGRAVMPADWVAASTRKQKSAAPKSPHDYGYLWWIRSLTTPAGATVNYYEAEGDGGNYIAVFPAQDLVVVFTGGNYFDSVTYDGQIVKILSKAVLPACGL